MLTMNSDDKGTYYIKTQQEIELVKKQLQKLKPNSQTSSFLQNQYNQLSDQLKTLEDKLSNVNQAFYDQLISNFDNTVQKLPNVNDRNLQPQFYTHTQNNMYQQSVQLPFIDQFLNVRTLPQVSVEPLGKSTLKPKGLHSVKSSIQFSRKFQSKKQSQQQLPKVDDLTLYKKGITELINQGTIKKQDINSLLNPNNIAFRNQQANFFEYSDQFGSKIVQIESQSFQNIYKTDLKKDSVQKNTQSQGNIQVKDNKVNFNEKKMSIQNKSKQKYVDAKEATSLSKEHERPITEQLQNLSTQQEYMIYVKNGLLQTDQLQYIQFQNRYYENWSKIEPILISLQKIAQSTSVKECRILGSKVQKLSQEFDRSQVFTMSELIQCFENWEELQKILKVPTLLYKSKDGKIMAATKISALFRGFKARKNYQRLKVMVEKVIIIQRSIRVSLFRKKVQKQIIKNNNLMLERFKNRQNVFKEEWPYLKLQQRFEIHLNSFSFEEIKRLSMDKFSQRQNTQITRIFNLQDPLVHIIYIAPYDLPSELIDYFYKILNLGDISDCKNRLYFVWPENHNIFNNHIGLSQLLYYSPRALKRIKSLIRGQSAYIVPGVCSNDDIKISDILNIPIFSGIPQLHQYYSTKSGCKVLFDELQLPQPPTIRNIYDEKELINSLSVLIIKNPNINTWIIKVDDEQQGRGIAWLEVQKMIKNLQPLEINQLAQLLTKKIKKKLHYAFPHLYGGYHEFIMCIVNRGGIIEGSPLSRLSQIHSISYNFKVEPDGDVSILGSYEKIKTNDIQTIASFSPQSFLKINQEIVCNQIAQKLYSKGLIGYFTIDTIGYQLDNNKQGFQVIGLDCFLNQYSSASIYFDFLMRGKLNISTGNYYVEDTNRQSNVRYSVYCPTIMNEGLDVLQYKTFFQLCRLESISFNLEKKIGSTFILVDSLQSGVISLMTVGINSPQVIKYMIDAIGFIQKNVGRGTESIQINTRSDKINMMSIHQKLKTMLKKLEGSEYQIQNSQYL
ncbi:unnamed protein product [Paramecium pentaurelia]|uniref:IQCH-like ATP-grasp domain-containing protein n=1 Tax=Paramecium pentaurelia TaxID=43138 RepID=A0A8S1VKZ5_9CILI|nr:unnamed protein product [Paramecium pentaurelia]